LTVAGGGLYFLGSSNKNLPLISQFIQPSLEGTNSAKLTDELFPQPMPTSSNQAISISNNSATTTSIDLTKLPLGDQKISQAAKKGYIFSCQTQNDGQKEGAFQIGPWINQSSKTWDSTKKLIVDGEVNWTNAKWSISVDGNNRVITSNGLPYHQTGVYPIATTDDAYQYDRNPNKVQEQTLSLSFPTNPTLLTTPECVGGEVGIMLSGTPLFNGFDATSRDANAYEIQDICAGHPQVSGQYHYHGFSKCIKDNSSKSEHSELLGYAFDGFGIYGPKGETGSLLSTSDLDDCHGHTHQLNWDGQIISIYHYHMSADFPYSIGCFRGKKTVNGPIGQNKLNTNGLPNSDSRQSFQMGDPNRLGPPPQRR
jgi:hypothetical protein